METSVCNRLIGASAIGSFKVLALVGESTQLVTLPVPVLLHILCSVFLFQLCHQ